MGPEAGLTDSESHTPSQSRKLQTHPYQNQPLKGLYLLWEVLGTAFIRAPLWTLHALPRSNRPRASWSLERVLRVRWLQYLPYIIAK
jgi:hypothetical protein